MTYEKAKEQAVAWLNGELNKKELAEFDEYLNSHPEFKQEFSSLKATWKGMENLKTPEPSQAMGDGFYAMLNGYKEGVASKKENGFSKLLQGVWSIWQNKLALQLVAGITIFFVGLHLGHSLTMKSNKETVVVLSEEIKSMKEMVFLSMLEQQSASKRLQAINIVYDIDDKSLKVVKAMLHTLDKDPNPNVRLAAVEMLTTMTEFPEVRLGLIKALEQQESPLVQSALVDAILLMEAEKSPKYLKRLLEKEGVNEAVKAKVKSSMEIYM
ncbi:HEAT repeat domain-containing protein [Flammeovirgaceae bacterium SG7u.111]|nr:HEAT repeat domain-containing protein [Flammeovirgaceae bacterium SG7u.132]WPO36954.1 HEAT repeat domain-containing protein [Flammeovirgaceae bacterium SG7u.111]